MNSDGRSISPFNPQQPVDPDFFVGRDDSIKRVLHRAQESINGNLRIIYLAGKKGIGKTSLAHYCRLCIEKELGAIGFHVFLHGDSGPRTLKDFTYTTVERIIKSRSNEASVMSLIEKIFKKFILEVKVGGVTIKHKELNEFVPNNIPTFYDFLRNLDTELHKKDKSRGVVLILDELDFVASEQYFVDLLKGGSDIAGVDGKKDNILIILCGTIDVFHNMVSKVKRVGDIIDLIEIRRLSEKEVIEFYKRSFSYLSIAITQGGLSVLKQFVDGIPQLMHLIGEETYLNNHQDRAINKREAFIGVRAAAEVWGKKYLKEKIHKLFYNPKYAPILKIFQSNINIELKFSENQILNNLIVKDEDVLFEFLKALEALNVIHKHKDDDDEYWVFNDRLLSLYFQVPHENIY